MANKIPSNGQWADLIARIKAKAESTDLEALRDDLTADYAADLSMSIDPTTFVITAQLQNSSGTAIGTEQTIDLPLESVVVGGSYDDTTKKVVLTLQSGSTVEFSVADLVEGLQSEITSTNMLDADLVNDETATHKFVTQTEKDLIATALQEIPIASDTVLGGIKVGDGLAIDATTGVLSSNAGNLYTSTGQNEDGAMTQKATTDAIQAVADEIPVEFTSTEWSELWDPTPTPSP